MNKRELRALESSLCSEMMKFTVEKISGVDAVKLTSQLTDRNGVPMVIYAYKREGKLYLTDGGRIITSLRKSHLDVALDLLQSLLRSFGLMLTEDESAVESSDRPLWQRTWAIFQAWATADGVMRTWARQN